MAATKSNGDELVEVELFSDGEHYKEPVPVIVNGVKIVVPRGEKVQIKRKYAEVLEHSMTQDREAGKIQTQFQREFEAETRRRGLDE